MEAKIIDILTEPRIITRNEYKYYCKRYKIKLMKKVYQHNEPLYIHKTLFEIAKDIYKYELQHNTIDGLYF